MSPERLEACWAFGAAALAVMAVGDEVAAAGQTPDPVASAYAELLEAHRGLRRLFARGAVEGVAEAALSVLVQAERTRTLLS